MQSPTFLLCSRNCKWFSHFANYLSGILVPQQPCQSINVPFLKRNFLLYKYLLLVQICLVDTNLVYRWRANNVEGRYSFLLTPSITYFSPSGKSLPLLQTISSRKLAAVSCWQSLWDGLYERIFPMINFGLAKTFLNLLKHTPSLGLPKILERFVPKIFTFL